ncbi:MAG: chromosome segregation protein SMC [Propionibacteriaceae bacterium]|nr:chromosome segregation protein SMC [Propionibacteriaceae bacterium]
MYLKKLTLRGFKSFASATSLTLEPGITCIVGPNGSGKSNVVDALAWVMGEQGAKTLRGGSMEDVIFAGTNSRAPLGRAEIQLTIDNSDGALPIDYSEVTISRTKFRNGNSEYAINGTTCRLLDVRELLSDSGIGREMHVVVGQGELDQILQATPETRRGLVEEAAGVLKHRERKEKALRKLEATQTNMNRLTDLLAEIRRQLKPLGRQADVAKRASVVQADVRDAKARLLADDLVEAYGLLGTQSVDEEGVRAQRQQVEAQLAQARLLEDESRAAMVEQESAYRRIQEIWFSLSGIAERVRSIVSVAEERVRYAATMPQVSPNPERDPDTLLAQAQKTEEGEARLRSQIADRAAALEAATDRRAKAEAAHAEAVELFEIAARASADRREGLARLSGQMTSVAARLESGAERLDQVRKAHQAAVASAEQATQAVNAAQGIVPGLEEAAQGLEQIHATAVASVDQARSKVEDLRVRTQTLTQQQAGLTARVDALKLAQQADPDGASWIAAKDGSAGVLGPVASLIRVEPGYEQAVAAALGAVADAVAVTDIASSVSLLEGLRSEDRGVAGLVIAADHGLSTPTSVPREARDVTSLLSGDERLVASLSAIMGPVLVVDSLAGALSLLDEMPQARVVTREGDFVSSWLVVGGSHSHQSALQIASALADAETELEGVAVQVSDESALLVLAQDGLEKAEAARDEARRNLEGAQGEVAAGMDKLSRLTQAVELARADAARLLEQVGRTEQDLDTDQVVAGQLRERLSAAETLQEGEAADPSRRDDAAEAARAARAAEMEARLGLRTLEERVRSLAGQAESLRKTAAAESAARQEAEQRRLTVERQAVAASRVARAGTWLHDQARTSVAMAEQERAGIGEARVRAEAQADNARVRVRELSSALEALVDSAHRDELSRAQQQMRIDALAERALTEVGIDAETLMAQYGPDQLVPVGAPDPDSGDIATVPFVRDEQLKRLRTAEKDLQILGTINPLALEEFDAMQERHAFLAGQLEDLKKTKDDLLRIVDDVDTRVQTVFTAAYADVAREFADTFARLFPGGEGRLALTVPDDPLTTGIEVEARPAGKRVKRLSLLSGGERSLVAVCFLIALFKARPSPFYILDEVEAALDDTNLGRLLDIYEELRATSQLLVITHQKRTMEMADTLYGVTMGSDGTSTVVSQRLREEAEGV